MDTPLKLNVEESLSRSGKLITDVYYRTLSRQVVNSVWDQVKDKKAPFSNEQISSEPSPVETVEDSYFPDLDLTQNSKKFKTRCNVDETMKHITEHMGQISLHCQCFYKSCSKKDLTKTERKHFRAYHKLPKRSMKKRKSGRHRSGSESGSSSGSSVKRNERRVSPGKHISFVVPSFLSGDGKKSKKNQRKGTGYPTLQPSPTDDDNDSAAELLYKFDDLGRASQGEIDTVAEANSRVSFSATPAEVKVRGSSRPPSLDYSSTSDETPSSPKSGRNKSQNASQNFTNHSQGNTFFSQTKLGKDPLASYSTNQHHNGHFMNQRKKVEGHNRKLVMKAQQQNQILKKFLFTSSNESNASFRQPAELKFENDHAFIPQKVGVNLFSDTYIQGRSLGPSSSSAKSTLPVHATIEQGICIITNPGQYIVRKPGQ
ncbi:unnamed protein product, partial [Lymnaea stagnalis]